ncbi:GPI transamidase component PIG-S-like [Sycon ciliatum]|uniref:GPI transamidase component PIG-S-like n=1 Tax=Sycon ciliatum TaxID=27933 RepID=UPI0031F6E30B
MDTLEKVQSNSQELADKLADQKLRLWTTFMVFILLAGFGVPLWWSTTTVYRATLPMQQINDLSLMKVQVKVELELLLEVQQLGQAANLQSSLEALLRQNCEDAPVCVNYDITVLPYPDWLSTSLSHGGNIKDAIARNSQGGAYIQLQSESTDNVLKYSIVLDNSLDSSSRKDDQEEDSQPSMWIGQDQYILLQNSHQDVGAVSTLIKNSVERALLGWDNALSAFSAVADSSIQPDTDRKADRSDLMAVTSTPGYRLAFTLVNSNPEHAHVDWNIKRALTNHLQPLLDQLSPLAEFIVDTQMLNFVSSKLSASRHGDEYHLTYDQLSHMINPLELSLGSHSSNLSTLHFIVYIPSKDESPLRVLNQEGVATENNSFLVDRWGGLLVHNVDALDNNTDAYKFHEISDDAMSAIMAVFAAQLKRLVGVRQPDVSFGKVSLLSSSNSISYREWNSVLLSRTVENVARARATLQALVKLLDDVSNMVISDHIQAEVVYAVQLIDKSLIRLAEGSLLDAYSLSRSALVASENAFFDPSMLALLYFPEESKYAIYVPLFIPMAVPVLASLVQSIKLFKTVQQLKSALHPAAASPAESVSESLQSHLKAE